MKERKKKKEKRKNEESNSFDKKENILWTGGRNV